MIGLVRLDPFHILVKGNIIWYNSKCQADSKMNWSKVETPQALSINLCAAVVENGIFFCSSLLLFEDTQRTFWHVNLIFSSEEENKYANFPTLYVGIQSHCISFKWWTISISVIHNIHSCAGIVDFISKKKLKVYEPDEIYIYNIIFGFGSFINLN